MSLSNKEYLSLPRQTLLRLPNYYQYLLSLQRRGVATVSAPVIAKALRWSDVLVRKDLAMVSRSGGKPKTGYSVNALLEDMRYCLGCDHMNEAVLVGAGQLGRALLCYEGFQEYGVNIVAAFDTNGNLPAKIHGKPVFPAEKLTDLCGRLGVQIGVITVPPSHAQEVCDMLIEGGVCALWNFAPVHLKVPEHITIKNEDMAASLARIRSELANGEEGPI